MPKLILLFTFYFSFFNIIHAQKLVFDHSTVNVGSTLWHQPVTAKFHYKSREREPIRIVAVDAGCGCLQPEWSKSDIKRGDEGDISITYDANLLGHFDRYINIYVAYAKDISNNASRSTLHASLSSPPLGGAGGGLLRVRMRGVVSTGASTIEDLFPVQIGDIGLSTTDVVFPDVTTNDSCMARIEIHNGSNEVFTPQIMHLPSYITARCHPKMLARGRRGYIDLTLHGDQLDDMGLTQTSIYLSRFSGDVVSPENEISLSAILLPDTSLFDSRYSTFRPSMKLSTNKLNLGELGSKKKLKGTISISNTGKKLLQLSAIQVFNNALEVSLPKREVAPGETIEMKVTLIAKYLPLSKAKPRVLIISDDPDHLKETIDIEFQ